MNIAFLLAILFPFQADRSAVASQQTISEGSTVESVLNQWRKREERFSSLKVDWIQSNSSPWSSIDLSKSASTTRAKCTAEIRKGQWRFILSRTSRHGLWSSIDQTSSTGTNSAFMDVLNRKFRPSSIPIESLFLSEVYCDGKECLSIFTDSENNIQKATAISSRQFLVKMSSDSPEQWIQPLLVAIAPATLHEIFCPAIPLQLDEKLLQTEGQAYLRLTATSENKDFSMEYWIDPHRDGSVKRSFLSLRGELAQQIDIEYEQDSQNDWVPSRWNLIMRGGRYGEPQRFPGRDVLFENSDSTSVHIRREAETKSPIEKPRLPTGTILVNLESQSASRINPDGTIGKRISETELLNPSPADTSKSTSWYSISIGTIILLLCTFLIWRRAFRKHVLQKPLLPPG